MSVSSSQLFQKSVIDGKRKALTHYHLQSCLEATEVKPGRSDNDMEIDDSVGPEEANSQEYHRDTAIEGINEGYMDLSIRQALASELGLNDWQNKYKVYLECTEDVQIENDEYFIPLLERRAKLPSEDEEEIYGDSGLQTADHTRTKSVLATQTDDNDVSSDGTLSDWGDLSAEQLENRQLRVENKWLTKEIYGLRAEKQKFHQISEETYTAAQSFLDPTSDLPPLPSQPSQPSSIASLESLFASMNGYSAVNGPYGTAQTRSFDVESAPIALHDSSLLAPMNSYNPSYGPYGALPSTQTGLFGVGPGSVMPNDASFLSRINHGAPPVAQIGFFDGELASVTPNGANLLASVNWYNLPSRPYDAFPAAQVEPFEIQPASFLGNDVSHLPSQPRLPAMPVGTPSQNDHTNPTIWHEQLSQASIQLHVEHPLPEPQYGTGVDAQDSSENPLLSPVSFRFDNFFGNRPSYLDDPLQNPDDPMSYLIDPRPREQGDTFLAYSSANAIADLTAVSAPVLFDNDQYLAFAPTSIAEPSTLSTSAPKETTTATAPSLLRSAFRSESEPELESEPDLESEPELEPEYNAIQENDSYHFSFQDMLNPSNQRYSLTATI